MYCGLSTFVSRSPEKSAVKELERKISVLDDALKQNMMSLSASEKARKIAESKLKETNKQVRDLWPRNIGRMLLLMNKY